MALGLQTVASAPACRGPHRRLLSNIRALRLSIALILFAAFLGVPPLEADEAFDLAPLTGRVIYLDFWASWCAPCRESFPFMNRLQKELGPHGLVVIGVNVDRNRADAQQFLRNHPAEFRIVYDPKGELPERFGVRGMPTSFLIDRTGHTTSRHEGFFLKDRHTLTQQVQTLLEAH
jgi:cytochrome c biogenesis protein CcmG/thiol:disulfide interchange protein DsbE